MTFDTGENGLAIDAVVLSRVVLVIERDFAIFV